MYRNETDQDNVSDLEVRVTAAYEDPTVADALDEMYRNEAAMTDQDFEQMEAAAQSEREQLARRTLGTIDPATASELAKLIEDRHGATGFYDVQLDGTVILHGKYYDLDPTELDALRSYVTEHNATAKVEQPRWETQVSICGKRFEAAVRTPAGKVVKVGRFFNEADAWNAAESRLAMLKAAAA